MDNSELGAKVTENIDRVAELRKTIDRVFARFGTPRAEYGKGGWEFTGNPSKMKMELTDEILDVMARSRAAVESAVLARFRELPRYKQIVQKLDGTLSEKPESFIIATDVDGILAQDPDTLWLERKLNDARRIENQRCQEILRFHGWDTQANAIGEEI